MLSFPLPVGTGGKLEGYQVALYGRCQYAVVTSRRLVKRDGTRMARLLLYGVTRHMHASYTKHCIVHKTLQVYPHTRIYKRTHARTHAPTNERTNARTRERTHSFKHARALARTRSHARRKHILTYARTHARTHAQTYTHTYADMQPYSCMHARSV